jgi:hypothetical protein
MLRRFGLLEATSLAKGKGLFGSGVIGLRLVDPLEGSSGRDAKFALHNFIIAFTSTRLDHSSSFQSIHDKSIQYPHHPVLSE